MNAQAQYLPTSLIKGEDLAEMLQLASWTPRGAFIEVGVYQGSSAKPLCELAVRQDRTLYLCDTFTGIPFSEPEKGDKHRVGDFGDVDFERLKAFIEDIGYGPPRVVWVPGVFPGSWNLVGALDQRFAFAHLDCDQYRSVKEASLWLIPRMVPGGVIWFDDVDRLEGATRAAEEVFPGKLIRDKSHPYVRL